MLKSVRKNIGRGMLSATILVMIWFFVSSISVAKMTLRII